MKPLLISLIFWMALCHPLSAQPLPPMVQQVLYLSQQAQEGGQDEFRVRQPLHDYLTQNDAPRHPLLYLALGNSWYRQQNWLQALKIYRSGLRHFPEDPQLTLNCAVTAFHAELFDQAARAFEDHAALVEAGSASRYHAALAYAYNGQKGETRRLMRALAQQHPVMDLSWLQLWFSAEVDGGRLARLQPALDRYLSERPAESGGWQLQLQLAMQQQQWTRALAAVELLNRLGTPSDPLLVAQLYQQVDLRFTAARRLPPATTPDRRWRQLVAAGDLEGAVEVLSRQFQRSPSVQTAGQLGRLYFRQGRWADARTAFLTPAEDSLPSDHWLYAGYCALEMGRLTQAKADFERVDPDSPHANSADAMVLWLETLLAKPAKIEKKI